MSASLFFHPEQTNVYLLYLVIWGYLPINTCVLHLVSMNFSGLTAASMHSLQVNLFFPVLNVCCSVLCPSPVSQVSLYWFPQTLLILDTQIPSQVLVSFLVSRQTNLLLWDLSYCWHHHYDLSLPLHILVIYWVAWKFIWTSGYYGKTGMNFLVNPTLSIFYISWVFLNPVFILPPLILLFFSGMYVA